MTNRLIPLALIALTAIPSVAGQVMALPRLAQEAPPTRPAKPTAQAPAEAAPEQPPETRGLAGPYLAARQAAIQNDYSTAGNYYLQALAQDDTNVFLQDSALIALISAGGTWMSRTPWVFWATTAVTTAMPKPPAAVIDLRSAAVPAPPVGSVPAIETTRGTVGRTGSRADGDWVQGSELMRTSLR